MDTHLDELLTPADVARLAGVTAAAVRNWESTGKLQVALRTVGGVRRPFGSAFWHNSARDMESEARLNIARRLHTPTRRLPSQVHLGRLRAPVGLQVTYRDEQITFESVDITTIDEVATSLPMHVRLRGALTGGPSTIAALAEELNAKPDTVKKALSRNKNLFACITSGADGVHRWALLERRTA